MRDAVVVGAGVIGTATALYLAREGLSVTVVDSHPAAGLNTSFANGGLLTPSTALPWCSPAVPGLLLKWIGREDAPLLLRPSALPGLGMWGARFFSNCRPSKFRASAIQLSRFARESLEETEGLIAQRTVDFNLSDGGLLELFRDEAGIASRDAYARFLESIGIEVERLNAPAVVGLEPHLAPIANTIRAGLLLPKDAWGDARKFSEACAEAAARLGVEFQYNTKIGEVQTREGRASGLSTDTGEIEARNVVVCAGPATPPLMAKLGVRVPIQPVKGYSISIREDDLGFLPNRPVVDDLARLGVAPIDGVLRVAGTVEFDGHNRTLRPGRIENLKRALRSLFPEVSLPADISPWCGLRPMSADGMPIIDETPVPGLFVNSGHGALGWTLACASARLLSDIVIGKHPPHASPFRLTRRFW
jgi:D-amino-acid dehydrogenase